MKRALTLFALVALTAASAALAQSVGEVTALSLVPTAGKADLVIGVRGAVQARDFILRDPARLVVDLQGARLRSGIAQYDGQARGGVRNVRYAQYQPDVVRVVVELDALTGYTVEQGPGEVRVRLASERTFASWSSNNAPASRAPTAPLALEVPSPSRGGQAQGEVVGNHPSAEAIAAYLAAHAEEAAQSQQPRISVVWDSASMAQVIQGFAAFSGRSIILGRDIKGSVTAEIRNQPWDLAMNAVLESQGLAADVLPGGIIRVADKSVLAKADSLEPLQTAVVRLNYARAASLALTLKDIVSKGRGSVVPDTATNALIITDIVSRIPDDTTFARSLDLRTPQVSIQAKIIFVDRSNIEALGVRYDLGDDRSFFNSVVPRANNFELRDLDGDGVAESNVPTDFFDRNDVLVALGGNALAAVGNASGNLGVGNPALELIFSTAIGNFDLTSFVSALQTVQLADIQAEPVTTTLDNQLARIQVGDRIPIRIVDVSSAATGGAVAQASIRFENVGIILEVTPHVTANHQILMRVKAERSSVQPGPVDIGFTFQTQLAETQLLVSDGETMVIGGLTVTEVTVAKSGIPFLVDLPIVGRLFGFSSTRENRRDLLILITPHIIDDLASPTQSQ